MPNENELEKIKELIDRETATIILELGNNKENTILEENYFKAQLFKIITHIVDNKPEIFKEAYESIK